MTDRNIDLAATFARLTRQAESARDFIADTRDLATDVIEVVPRTATGSTDHSQESGFETVLTTHGETRAFLGQNGITTRFPINPNGHRQLAEKVGIPWAYYSRMQSDAPGLLNKNVNHWFATEPKRVMVRTLYGVRAFLSDRYRRIDHIDVLRAVLPRLESNGYRITDFQVSDTRLVMRAVYPEPVELRKVGDVAERGVRISNSEVGRGAFVTEPYVRILSCLNGMTMPDSRLRRNHVGASLSDGLLSEETINADEQVFIMKSADMIDAIADCSRFRKFWDAIETAGGMTVESPLAAAELLATKAGLNKTEGEAVRDGFLRAADPTVWGLLQSLTAFAHEGAMGDEANMDRRAELESVAGRILLDVPTRAALVAAA